MFTKIEHIGIAVKNIQDSNALYTALLGVEPYKSEMVPSEQVLTSFFKIGTTKIELLQGLAPEGTIQKFIDKKGEGMHHIAFEVEDIQAEIKRLQANGFVVLSENPKAGADNKLVCFLHPKSTQGVLIELCQEIRS
jgi:methylmalonyl-CoA/ethylmalonyl-CoA epimerase